MRHSQRDRWGLAAFLAVLVLAGSAIAQTPQTILIDGINDFLPGNLIDADQLDVQIDPPPQDYEELDITDLHVTNDAVNLYIGFGKSATPFGATQLGIAIDVGTAAGGDIDPWGRQLEWSLAANKPDFMFYVNLDNNWQAGYSWDVDSSSWVDLAAPGPGSLGWVANTDFAELGIMLGSLGVSAGNTINVEGWLTQDSPTKGPLDAFANDAVQLSLPGFTLWDTSSPVPMTLYHPYTIQAAADPDPPVVLKLQPTSYPVDSFFDLFFNEPVDPATAEATINYSLSEGGVVTATRDGSDPSIVHLVLDGPLAASSSLYQITVANVEDLAGNPITENGVDNTACMGLKNVVFRGKMGPFLANQGGAPPYTFTVEGGKSPLTWSLCDNATMSDVGDDIYEWSTVMSYPGDCAGGTGSETFEWKFVFDCSVYEPLASNRTHTLDITGGATDVLEFWWNDEDPSQFTTHDIDVEFFVDMNNSLYLPGDTVTMNGSVLPLTFDVPSITPLVDDGSGNDAQAGDGIFSTLVTFPTGSDKDVSYKFLLNDEYECSGQGDRYVYLNDEMYDTVGGTLGPLTLPVVKYDFCSAIWRAVDVVFSVDLSGAAWDIIQPTDVVGINGTPNHADPPTFDWTVPSLNPLADDGIYPDALAGDRIYTVMVTFPDTSSQYIEYKYLFNDIYECFGSGNHSFFIDPDNYDATGNPQVLPADVYHPCDIAPVPRVDTGMALDQNTPNPFNPSTEIKYSVGAQGEGSLRIFNLRGEIVRTLREGVFPAGPGSVVWDGRSDAGAQAGSGVYFYRLEVGGKALTRRMVLLK